MGHASERQLRSDLYFRIILVVVDLALWYWVLPMVLADVVASGAKTAALVGWQTAWCVAVLVVMALAFQRPLGLRVSCVRMIGVLGFSLLWPMFLQGFELGAKRGVQFPGVFEAEAGMSLIALVIVALVVGEVIRLPKWMAVQWPRIQWKAGENEDPFKALKEQHERGLRDNNPYAAGSSAWVSRKLREGLDEW